VQYHPIEGTTTQGSTTQGAHSASKNFSENPRADIQPAVTETLTTNEYTEAQALQQANWICSNPQHAKPHWEKFKIRVENEAKEKARLMEKGLQNYVSPKWARQPSVSFDQAVIAVDQIQGAEPKSPQIQESKTSQDSQADDWINPVESVQNWLADIETKWTGIYRGITQRFFSSAIDAKHRCQRQSRILPQMNKPKFTNYCSITHSPESGQKP